MAVPSLTPIKTTGFGWGYDLSADGHPEMALAGYTVDWDTVAALGADLTLPDGNVVAAGTKILLPGQVMAGITGGEITTLTITATGGTYTLTVNGATTGALAFNANAAAIDAAVEALAGVGAGKVTVTGAGPFSLAFDPTLGDVTVTVATGALTGGTATIATAAAGGRTRLVGPYDPAAVDGRGAALAGRDDIGLIRVPYLYDPTRSKRLYDTFVGLIVGGYVKKGLVRAHPTTASLVNGPTWADLRVALPRLLYATNRRASHT